MRQTLMIAALLYPATAAASSFERFDAPGATSTTITCGTAISSDSLVAGDVVDGPISIGTAALSRTPIYGPFLYRSGRFTHPKPAVENATATVTGVNRLRTITGYGTKAGVSGLQNFVLAGGVTSFPTVAGGTITALSGITDSGTLLGLGSPDVASPPSFVTLGFLKTKAGEVTILDDGTGSTEPAGMDKNAHYIVGNSLSGSWVFDGQHFTAVTVPGAIFTFARGVDTQGHVVGSYIAGTSPNYVTHGFRLHGGIYTSWDVPGADDTQINAANEAGQMTGCFSKGGRIHGFLYTP